ncbi:MAG: diguanylate cyclase [Giesbergeria sp.]|uniref:sensor domain-containing diguanylate cyclase n=1 Tax=Giesbergeria sp. TaxID=2818473 RepID=UPI00262A516B|nr:diguanylate cyclase [Giesbergeria sp.]MDD2608606.1 diguanylate cyclase [Giesbergeria sp.]
MPLFQPFLRRLLPTWRSRLWLALGLLALGGILWGLPQVYQSREEHTRHQIERELHAINYLQTQSVLDWREQRLIDASALVDDSLFTQSAAQWLQVPEATVLTHRMQERLRILQERAKYTAVYLTDPQGQLWLTPNGSTTGRLPTPELQALESALAQAQVTVLEPRRDAFFAFPFLSVIVPLFEGTEPVGAIWLVSDVRASLYTKLQTWPTPRETAESILLSRHGDEVRTLNPLRHSSQGGTTVFQLAQLQADDPIVQAVAGARGILYGHDYRGHHVMAMVSAVSDSSWIMVSKIDIAEAFADTQLREILALSLPVSLLLLLAGLVFAYGQRRAWRRERELKTQLQRNMRWLEGAQKAASVGYFALDLAQEQFLMSSMATEIFGLPNTGVLTLEDWMRAIVPEDRAEVIHTHRQAIDERTPLRLQYRIQRLDNHEQRWLEVWGEYENGHDANQVARMIGTIQDITERKQSEQELANYRNALEEKVRLDPMTQIPNRRALDEHVLLEWHRAMRNHTPLSLLMIDVDYFKSYNDHYGHVAGDECLRQVATAIAACACRSGELAARYGGEEFSVLLPGNDAAQAQRTAECIRAAIEALALEHRHSQVAACVTISVGVTSVQPVFAPLPQYHCAETDTVPQAAHILFTQADEALYQAKQQGRNRVVAYQDSTTTVPGADV